MPFILAFIFAVILVLFALSPMWCPYMRIQDEGEDGFCPKCEEALSAPYDVEDKYEERKCVSLKCGAYQRRSLSKFGQIGIGPWSGFSEPNEP